MQQSMRFMSVVIVLSLVMQGTTFAIYPSHALPKQGAKKEVDIFGPDIPFEQKDDVEKAELRKKVDLLTQMLSALEEKRLQKEDANKGKETAKKTALFVGGIVVGGCAAVLAVTVCFMDIVSRR